MVILVTHRLVTDKTQHSLTVVKLWQSQGQLWAFYQINANWTGEISVQSPLDRCSQLPKTQTALKHIGASISREE